MKGFYLDRRICIVLEHYTNFIPVVNAYECNLIDTIKEEREYNRRRPNGNLGVRVQTSNITNPTEDEAEIHESIENAVRNGDYATALRGADNYDEHKEEILTLWHMRKTYYLVAGQLSCLDDELKQFKGYVMHEFDLATIADSEGVSVEAIKKRFRKAKGIVIKGARHWIDKQMQYKVLEKGA